MMSENTKKKITTDVILPHSFKTTKPTNCKSSSKRSSILTSLQQYYYYCATHTVMHQYKQPNNVISCDVSVTGSRMISLTFILVVL